MYTFPDESMATPLVVPQVSVGTVTTHVAVLLPSAVVTVMLEDPTPIPVTSPVVETVATAVLLLAHAKPWLVAFDGVIVTASW
jgi:hypothetical protein